MRNVPAQNLPLMKAREIAAASALTGGLAAGEISGVLPTGYFH